MSFLKIILFTILIFPLMLLLSGCFDDAILDAIKAEEDFIAPYTVVEERPNRTVYFEISDSRVGDIVLPGDDASYKDVPNAVNFDPGDNFDGTGDNVVVDNVSGLMWTKCPAMSLEEIDNSTDCSATPYEFEWIEAADILEIDGLCDKLDYAGFTDWRMPTASELFSIMNFDLLPSNLNPAYFPHTLDVYYYPPGYEVFGLSPCDPDYENLNKNRRSYSFWSFTSKYIPYEVYTVAAYYEISYYFHALKHEKRTEKHFVRCVRNNI
jgi:hypothetical protein